MAHFEDLTGKTFGSLTVLGQAPPYISPSGKKTTCWRVRCESCGTEKVMLRNTLIYATSCGCQRIEKIRVRGIAARNKKICPVCGKEFSAPPSGRVTCSEACASLHISAQHIGKDVHWSEEARQRYAASPAHLKQAKAQVVEATKAAMELPESQKGPQHRESKVWIVKAPDNTTVKIVGLAQWARENYMLFEPETTDPAATVKRICSGFIAMSSSINGYRRDTGRVVGQYKGWQLLSVLDKDDEEQEKALAEFVEKAKK